MVTHSIHIHILSSSQLHIQSSLCILLIWMPISLLDPKLLRIYGYLNSVYQLHSMKNANKWCSLFVKRLSDQPLWTSILIVLPDCINSSFWKCKLFQSVCLYHCYCDVPIPRVRRRHCDIYTQVRDTPHVYTCLLYTSPSPRDRQKSRMPSSA